MNISMCRVHLQPLSPANRELNMSEKTRPFPPEQQVRLSKAVRIVEYLTEERVHVATLHRWSLRGLHGVHLKTSRVGGYKSTCENWIQEFFHAVATASGSQAAASHPKSKERLKAAELSLSKDGI